MVRSTVMSGVVLVAVAIGMAACSGGGTANLKEIQKQRAGDYVVTLLNDSGQLKQGKNEFVLEVRNASDNQLVDAGPIQTGTSMPMPGAPNMVGEITVTPTDTKGRYTVSSTMQMKGQWTTTFTFQNGQKVTFALRTQ